MVDRCTCITSDSVGNLIMHGHSIQEVAVLIFCLIPFQYNYQSWWSTMFEAPQEMKASTVQTTQAERQRSRLHFHTAHPILQLLSTSLPSPPPSLSLPPRFPPVEVR